MYLIRLTVTIKLKVIHKYLWYHFTLSRALFFMKTFNLLDFYTIKLCDLRWNEISKQNKQANKKCLLKVQGSRTLNN